VTSSNSCVTLVSAPIIWVATHLTVSPGFLVQLYGLWGSQVTQVFIAMGWTGATLFSQETFHEIFSLCSIQIWKSLRKNCIKPYLDLHCQILEVCKLPTNLTCLPHHIVFIWKFFLYPVKWEKFFLLYIIFLSLYFTIFSKICKGMEKL
jgi:hypothetical protein